MNTVKLVLATITIFVVVSSINSVFAENNTQIPGNNMQMILPTNSLSNFTFFFINNIYIDISNASSQNANPVFVGFDVRRVLKNTDLCVNSTLFKLTTLEDTLENPSAGPVIVMKYLLQYKGRNDTCMSCKMAVAPKGLQAYWIKGTYIFRLDFSVVQDGPIEATRYIAFQVQQ